jgi:hypothetical protein
MKLWDKISSLIQEGGKDEPPPATTDRSEKEPEMEAAGPPPLTAAAAASAVLGMLPKGQSLDQFAAGQIQLLNLESVRDELGDRWSKVEHQVHLLVEATLRRILTASDIFTQIDEFEYLVIFPNLTEQKASALMYVAAAQIRQKLFGRDPAFAAIRLNATVTKVTKDAIQNAADPVAALHEAALLGQPAALEPELEEKLLATPGFVPWTDKYKIVPITGGGMTKGHLVADAPRGPGKELDFASLSSESQGAAQHAAKERESGPEQAAVRGYTVYPIAGNAKSEGQLVAQAQSHRRLPDFPTRIETAEVSSSDHSIPAPQATGADARGYPVYPISGNANSEGQLVAQAQSHRRLPDFPTRIETAEKPTSDRSIPAPQPQATGADGRGYPVYPITGGSKTEGQLVQQVARALGRMADFSSTAREAADWQTSPAPSAQVGAPALSTQLDALIAKSPKAIQITRPAGADDSRAAAAGAASVGTASGVPSGQPALPQFEELQLLYEPIWDVRRQAVTTYRMKIAIKVSGEVMGLAEFSMTYDDPKLQWTINSAIIRKLVSQVQHSRGDKRKAITIAPLGRRFIDDESGLRFILDQLSLLSDQERQLVMLEIGDVYFGSWPTLGPRIAVVRRVCRNIGIRLSLDHKDFQQVAATGAASVSGDLLDHDWPERQALGALNEFAAAASKASLKSSVGGLTTSSMVIAAISAGFDYLSGSAIGEGTPTPLGVYPLSTEGFYLQRQAQRLQQDQGGDKGS